MLDTVAAAASDPDREQPWADLGLKADEYDRIREILGRRPTSSELAMYSVMWSEHCSYKSSKVHLKQFGEIPQETPVGKMLAGIGENAGVLDIGQGYAVTFKVESHNHPSYVEPYQGAATGVGGIVRDILAMGARPVAVMDPLRFGPLDAEDTHRVLPGIVAGVGGYGNCLGLPNIGGEAVFDPTYLGNPLVNALCVGVLRHEDLHLAKASGKGNQVILYGARTGGDGIGGVSVLASETFDADGPAKRPSVQVGDPFMEKLLIECTLELFQAGVVAGIQDLGGAGLSCATSELASAGDGGMRVELDRVPLRDSTLAPEEILMSESQERMMAVVEPGDVDGFLGDLRASGTSRPSSSARSPTAAGSRSTGTARPSSTYLRGRSPTTARSTSARSPARTGRTRSRPTAPRRCRGRATGDELRETLLRLVASPNLCDKSWITDQYDRYVQGNTVLAQPADSGMVRVDEETHLGVSVATDCNGRFAKLDPYAGAQLALAEAYRNVATGGARPLAVSDCLNFGSPEDPGVMWQFAEALPRPQGRLPHARHPGHRRQRQPLQPDRRDRDPADAGRRRARRDRRRTTPHAVRVPGGRRADRAARRAPARSCPAASGRTSSTGTSAACRRRSTWSPSATWPGCSPTWSASPPARTTSPTAAWPRRSPRPACVRRRRRHGRARVAGDAFVGLFSESAARAIVTRRGRGRSRSSARSAPATTCRWPSSARPAATRWSWTVRSPYPWPSCAPRGRRPCPPRSARSPMDAAGGPRRRTVLAAAVATDRGRLREAAGEGPPDHRRRRGHRLRRRPQPVRRAARARRRRRTAWWS